LNKEHGALLREEDDGCIGRRGNSEKLAKERETFRVELRSGYTRQRSGEFVLVSFESRRFEEDRLDSGENGT